MSSKWDDAARVLPSESGVKVRHRRWMADMMRSALAERSGIDAERLEAIESGCVRMSMRELAGIAGALGVPVHAIYAGEPGDVEPAAQMSRAPFRLLRHPGAPAGRDCVTVAPERA